ncbi:UBAP1-MVB12-associated (UMA)-domain containing protein 1 isoform X2 [Macrotis lagotis]|uniref:UBAP1-MVB12-associated (UMA)-domain containing protein 1 isoform X2 n=1 Tax=Macrotis lagotis TaxID=92651 RepID=UPI003D68A0EC
MGVRSRGAGGDPAGLGRPLRKLHLGGSPRRPSSPHPGPLSPQTPPDPPTMFHFFRKPAEPKKAAVPEAEADGFVLLGDSANEQSPSQGSPSEEAKQPSEPPSFLSSTLPASDSFSWGLEVSCDCHCKRHLQLDLKPLLPISSAFIGALFPQNCSLSLSK